MEYLGNFIISHSSMVVIGLSGSVLLCVMGLLLISFHHPNDAVTNELGSVDRIEGVLRQILSEQDWPKMKGADMVPSSGEAASAAEGTPAEGAPTEAASASATPVVEAPPAPPAVDVAPLENKIKELEEKLAEYSVIEEDIADLSRFRQENEELKKKITHATGVSADEATSMPWDDFEKVVKDKNASSATAAVATTIEKT